MGTDLRLNELDYHAVRVAERDLLFHIPSSSLFEASADLTAVMDTLRREGPMSRGALGQRLPDRPVERVLSDLCSLGIVADGGSEARALPPLPEQLPITTAVLNINTGCNLSCTYCYKEDLAKPADGEKMSLDTALGALEMLFEQSPQEPRYNLVFFGGEPLSNLPLIHRVIEEAEKRCAARGKRVDFSMTTNATLLDERTIDWLDAHRVGIAVSIDGPQAMHDRNRITVGGQGTYATVARKVGLLLSRYRSRPVGARVTLTRGSTDVLAIWQHLFEELGFAEVGFAPVTAGDIASYNLTEPELDEVFGGFRILGERYIDAAIAGRNLGFSNLHQLLTDIHEGHAKSLPCGAGYSMLAVDKDGGLNLCHRFTGSELPTFGSVDSGPDRQALGDFLAKRLDRSDSGCASCRIRNLCSGGCYHESYQRYGDPTQPVYHYCDRLRDWVDFGIQAYARILDANPQFFDRYLTPRRTQG